MKLPIIKPSARVKGAPPSGNCGGGQYSSAVSRHPYASTPPSKRGTKIKRDTMDQFNTHRGCTAPKPYTIQSVDREGKLRLETGCSTQKARVKCILHEERKPQRKMRKVESWGIRVASRTTPSDQVLDNARAAKALQRLACQKIDKAQAERGRREAESKLLRTSVIAPVKSGINCMGNAFAALGV